MILEQCKRMHCVDLGESFQTQIFLQNLASIQPRTSPLKFARSSARAPAARSHAHRADFSAGAGGQEVVSEHPFRRATSSARLMRWDVKTASCH